MKESKTYIKLNDAQGKLIYQAKLKEDALDLDPTSKEGSDNAPPFHGYSKAGRAEGQLVYAHVCICLKSHSSTFSDHQVVIHRQSGTVEDFKRLKENGKGDTGHVVSKKAQCLNLDLSHTRR